MAEVDTSKEAVENIVAEKRSMIDIMRRKYPDDVPDDWEKDADLIEALSRDLEAMRAERDALRKSVAELAVERDKIGTSVCEFIDKLIGYLNQNASAHKDVLSALKAARASLSKEGGE